MIKRVLGFSNGCDEVLKMKNNLIFYYPIQGSTLEVYLIIMILYYMLLILFNVCTCDIQWMIMPWHELE